MSDRLLFWLSLLVATVVAILGATTHAGGWNDASRLATIESLVDRHTWIIDESVFVRPVLCESGRPHPFGSIANQFPNGTQDKLFINGHFYSDKSPVPAVFLAAPYQLWRWCGGPSAVGRPDLFCWFLSLVAAGGAFILAVLGIYLLAAKLRLPNALRTIVVFGFLLGTIALPYSRSVNNHILFLCVATWLLVTLEMESSVWVVGTLAGIAYTIDLGAGPVVLLSTFVLQVYRTRSLTNASKFLLAVAPWLLLHHTLNFMIGGTLAPANANASHFRWSGCPFNSTNLTGGWPHSSPWAFAIYAVDLLIGKKGFLTHQPQIYFAIAATIVLWRTRQIRIDMLVITTLWFVGIWLMYAMTSRNQSGVCVSVRWFVPLIAPAYYWLILGLKSRPNCYPDVLTLTIGGAVINLIDWFKGPWNGSVGAYYWIVVAGTGLSWGTIAYSRRNQTPISIQELPRVAA